MLFNVAQLMKEGIAATRHLEVDGELYAVDENNPGPTPVKGHITLVRTPTGVLVTGTVRLKLMQTCRRCLELSGASVTLEVEEEFVPSIDIETGASLPIADGQDPNLVIDAHHILDLTEVLRQCAVVGGAGFGLCRSGCKGLCSSCGANLNLGPCACDNERLDPRLAILGRLLETHNRSDDTN